MYGFFQRLNDKLRKFMYGRYGIDELGTFLLTAGIIMAILSIFRPLAWLSIPALVVMVWSYSRTLSRNFDKRRAELYAYKRISGNVRERTALIRRVFRERKTHKFFKCRMCRTRLRVPRGKGKIEVTCPKCRAKVIKKT